MKSVILAITFLILYTASCSQWTRPVKVSGEKLGRISVCADANNKVVIADASEWWTKRMKVFRLNVNGTAIEKTWNLTIPPSYHGFKQYLYCRQNLANDIYLLYENGDTHTVVYAESTNDGDFEAKYSDDTKSVAFSTLIVNNATGRVTVLMVDKNTSSISYVTRPPDDDTFSEEVIVFENPSNSGPIASFASSLLRDSSNEDIWNIAFAKPRALYFLQVTNNGANWNDTPTVIAEARYHGFFREGVNLVSNPDISSALFMFFEYLAFPHNFGTVTIWSLNQGVTWTKPRKVSRSLPLASMSPFMCGTKEAPSIVLEDHEDTTYRVLKSWTETDIRMKAHHAPLDIEGGLLAQGQNTCLLQLVGDSRRGPWGPHGPHGHRGPWGPWGNRGYGFSYSKQLTEDTDEE